MPEFVSFEAFKASCTYAANLPATLGMHIDEIGFATGLVFEGNWWIGIAPTGYQLVLSNMQWDCKIADFDGLESLTWRLYGEYLSNFPHSDKQQQIAERMANNLAFLFHKEFPDYPVADMPEIPLHFEDTSWHNDSCPSFTNKTDGLILFADFIDPAKREFDDAELKRFALSTCSDDFAPQTTLCYSDNWQDVLTVIIGRKFADVLREWLGDDFETMRKVNGDNINAYVCRSHDFCDANMAMDEAFKYYGINAFDPANQAQADLFNAAWNYAKTSGLIASNDSAAIATDECDFEPVANVLESLVKELPETLSVDDARNHPALARIIRVCDDIANRTDRRAIEWIKTQG